MHRQVLGRVAAVLVALAMPAAVAANYSSPAYTVDTGGWRMATLLRSSPSQVGATAVPSTPPPFPTTGGPRNATQTAAAAAYTFTAVVVPTASMITAGPSATVIYTISPTSTMLVPAGASRVMLQAVPVDDVVRGAVAVARVDVPDVVVIYPGGIAAFPGLTPGSGFFRVVVDTLLLTYRIEACAAEYANRVLVEERPGIYRALGCAAAECRQMLPVERGLIHIAPCYGDDCRRKIVCQARACRAVLCRNDCYQVQLCEPRGCRTAMPAAFSADDAAGSGLALAKQPPVGQGVVVGLIRAAVTASARSLAGSSNDVAPAQDAQHGRPLKPIRGNGFGPARPEPGCGRAGHGSSAEHGPTRLHAPDAPSRPERQASSPAAVALGRGSGPLAVTLPGLAAAVGLAPII